MSDIDSIPARKDSPWFDSDFQRREGYLLLMRDEEEIPLEPSWIRCSIIARIGAIPVPGPTKIHGTTELGVRIPPLTRPTGISEPVVKLLS